MLDTMRAAARSAFRARGALLGTSCTQPTEPQPAQVAQARRLVQLRGRVRLLLHRSTMTATTDDLCSHVAAHAGVPIALAERATRTVLAGMAGTLTPAGRELVADELPAGLGAAILADSSLATPVEDRVVALGVGLGQARELIASVCRVLVEELSGEAVDALRVGVPTALAALLVEPVTDEPPPRPALDPRHDTLSDGRPGSQHPLSAGRGAQRGSIADDNPHAVTRLSSTAGSNQERHRETLSEGRPGARYPLSSGRG
jgi:uncharacterized protein (DUF2267 family)